ncbi:MAG TPA: hypothetical protein ENK19_02350, partial [Acidobacteria bacterium]|nr:hypothetical protein [Acidobacteriota bacterium]
LLGIGIASWGTAAGAVGFHVAVAAIPGALPWPGPHPPLGASTIMGAIPGGALAAAAWAALRRDGVWTWLDALAGAAPLGQAIGRLGCLSAGCCYGKPTSSPLGMRLADLRGVVAVRYPAQLIASIADLTILAAILLLERHLARRGAQAPGTLFGAYLVLYGTMRFLLELLRATANPILAGMTWAQLVAVADLLVGAVICAAAARRRARRPKRSELY